jgi:putative hydrolase of the HAD superfamily
VTKPARQLPPIRAVLFDAVGTLIHPEPPAGAVYGEAGRRFGSRRDPATIAARFRAAFRRQEELDRAGGLRTDERREWARWWAIVTEVLDDVADAAACFRYLYDHFAAPGAWRVEAGAGPVLRALAGRGIELGVASNFDGRLRGVLAGLTELAPLRHVVISAEVGWRKPAGEFFRAACRATGCAPEEVLIVGDDVENDYAGARAAGLAARLFDPHDRHPGRPRIARLHALLDLL